MDDHISLDSTKIWRRTNLKVPIAILPPAIVNYLELIPTPPSGCHILQDALPGAKASKSAVIVHLCTQMPIFSCQDVFPQLV